MFSLLPYNTFALDVHAQHGIVVNALSDLKFPLPEPYIILGRGSDVLFTSDFEGTALINNIRGVDILHEDNEYLVRVGGGEILDELIVKLLNQGICGLENLSAIPGTVGAAPIQNIGAYGVEIGNFIASVEVCDLKSGKTFTLDKDACQFGYRDSYFKRHPQEHLFIIYVNFRFPDEPKLILSYQGLRDQDLKDAQAVRAQVRALRARKLPDPRYVGNAGSFFKNPLVDAQTVTRLREQYPDIPVFTAEGGRYKLAAGWLIDKAGCRGITHGHAGTWEHQALVLVNRGQAKPHEIVSLAKYVSTQVMAHFGIELVPEVRLYGRNGEVAWDLLL